MCMVMELVDGVRGIKSKAGVRACPLAARPLSQHSLTSEQLPSTQQLPNGLETILLESLGKDVGFLKLGADVYNLDAVRLEMGTEPMVLDSVVLGAPWFHVG